MKKVVLSTLLALLVVFPSSVLADPPTVNIPPTNAYEKIITSNGSITAPNFIGAVHYVGQGHISITSSNGSQTVYFNGAPITPVGDRFGWYASNTIGNGGTKDLHLYNFSTGHGISATVGPDDFILSAVNFVNASSKSCASNQFLHSFDNNTGIFICLPVNSTGPLDVLSNIGNGMAAVYAGNTTNHNFQFKRINATGSITITNGTSVLTIHGNVYQNNTGLNIGKGGKGVYAGNTGSILNFKNITSVYPSLFKVTSNTTDVQLNSTFKSNSVTCVGNSKISAFNNATGVYTCSGGAGSPVTGALNIGKGGFGPYAGLSGTNLQFKNITSTSNLITVNANTTDINVSTPILTTANTWTKSQNFSNGIWIPVGNYTVSIPSFIVYIDKHTDYIAKNGTDGRVVFNSTDAATTLNNVITVINQTHGGGWVTVRHGDYPIKSALKIPVNGHMRFTGEDMNSTRLYIPSGFDNDMFTFNHVRSSHITDSFFNSFSDFEAEGNNGTGGVNNEFLRANSTNIGFSDGFFTRVFVWQFKGNCFDVNPYNDWNFNIVNSIVELCDKSAVVTQNSGSDMKILQSKFLFNGHGAPASGTLLLSSQYVTVTNNWFYKNQGYDIVVQGSSNNGVIISDNRFLDSGVAANNTYANVALSQSGKNVLINNNIFFGTDSSTTNRIKYGVDIETTNNGMVSIQDNSFCPANNSVFGTGKIHIVGGYTDTNTNIFGNICYNPPNSFSDNLDPSKMAQLIGLSSFTTGHTNQYTLPNKNGTIALTSDLSGGTITSSQNIGKGTGSSGVLASPTSTIIQGKNITTTSPITNTNNSTDITIACSTCLTAAITSINSQTGSAYTLQGTTGNVTITNSTNHGQINLGSNVVVTNGVNQTIAKALTFTAGNKLSVAPSSRWSSLNIGTAAGNPTSPRQGDIWIGGEIITYKSNTNSTHALVNTDSSQNIGAKNFLPTNFLTDSSDTTKRLGWVMSGMTAGTTLTLRGNQTTSQGLNFPAIRETETLAVVPQSNFTSGHNGGNSTGTTSGSYVMLGNYATITPQVTGNIRVEVTGYWDNSVATDGCTAKVMVGTSNLGVNGGALTGSLVGLPIKSTSATLSANSTLAITVASTGNAVGTKLFFDFGFARVTGGQCTMRNVEWLLQEY